MIELINNRSYRQYVLSMTLILMLVSLGCYFFKPQYLAASAGLFIILELIILSRRFTYKLSVSNTAIQIVYYEWGIKKGLTLDVQSSEVEESITSQGRGHKAHQLKILTNGVTKYTFDTSEGFDSDDLNAAASAIRAAKPKT